MQPIPRQEEAAANPRKDPIISHKSPTGILLVQYRIEKVVSDEKRMNAMLKINFLSSLSLISPLIWYLIFVAIWLIMNYTSKFG